MIEDTFTQSTGTCQHAVGKAFISGIKLQGINSLTVSTFDVQHKSKQDNFASLTGAKLSKELKYMSQITQLWAGTADLPGNL
jgi:hypothetical protein